MDDRLDTRRVRYFMQVLDSGSVRGAPVSLSGRAVLVPAESGSQLKFTATVEVLIPLVGGKIESFIGGKLADLVMAEQRFTTLWIAESA